MNDGPIIENNGDEINPEDTPSVPDVTPGPPPPPPIGGVPYSAPGMIPNIPTDPFAMTSIVLAILTFPLCGCCGLGLVTSIGSIIFGFIGLSRIKSSPTQVKGHELAVVGLSISFVVVGIYALSLLSIFGINLFTNFYS